MVKTQYLDMREIKPTVIRILRAECELKCFFLTMTIINLMGIIIGMLRFEYPHAPCSAVK